MIVFLQPINSLFFAGTAEFKEHLPDVDEAYKSIVIPRLRDRAEVSSTFIRAVQLSTNKLQEGHNLLRLVGISTHVLEQMGKTAILDLIGRENEYLAEPKFTTSLIKALVAANQWLIDSTASPEGE